MADESEIAELKIKFGVFEQSLLKMEAALKEMMGAMQQFALAEAKRSTHDEMLGRIFKRLAEIEGWQKNLAEEAAKKEVQEAEKVNAKLQKELDVKNKHIWDVRSILITAAVMMVAWIVADKLGIKAFG